MLLRRWNNQKRVFDEEVYAAGQINLIELFGNITIENFLDERLQTKKIKYVLRAVSAQD